jgi:hypothetical protein
MAGGLLLVWGVSEMTGTTVCLASPLLVDKYIICLQQPASKQSKQAGFDPDPDKYPDLLKRVLLGRAISPAQK